jgi:cell division protein FtsQ
VGGIITLLVSANSKAKTRTCKGVVVSINNDGKKIYVEKEDVLKSIEKTAGGSIVKKNTGGLNLAQLEKALEKNPWIQDVQMYFDTKDVLHVAVSERVPVARVFTVSGGSYYIDSAGFQLPLLEGYSARLPVVTGFTAAKRFNAADSALLQQTKEVVKTISTDAFWNAQVGQIDITPDKKFELIPVIGSHVIRLGSGYGVEEKLSKLMVFYKQVLPNAGFAKYSALDVQFEGQVVAVKRGLVSKVDSIQLHKNIEELMKKKLAEQEPDDAVPATVPVATMSNGDFDVEPDTKDTVAAKPVVKETSTAPQTTALSISSTPVKKPAIIQPSVPKKTTEQTSKPVVKPKSATESKPAAPKPKAVMQPGVENDY